MATTTRKAAVPARKAREFGTAGRIVCWCLVVGSVATLTANICLHRYFRLPKPTGPFAVGTTIIDYTDFSRHESFSANPAARRHVVVQLWYPAGASRQPRAAYRRFHESLWLNLAETFLLTDARLNAAPLRSAGMRPLLLFNPRWGGERTQNTALTEDLASHGYIVAALDHPYNSNRVQLDAGEVIRGQEDLAGPKGPNATAADQIAFWNESLALWTADQRFVLDRLLADSASSKGDFLLCHMIEPTQIGAFGHSFGGSAALAMLGADSRVKAGLNMDGWVFGGLDHRTAEQPVMILYEDGADPTLLEPQPEPQSSADGDVEAQMNAADRVAVGGSLNRLGGWRIDVHGAQHLDFTDQPLLPLPHHGHFLGPITPAEIGRLTRETVLAFFDSALLDRPRPLLSSEHAFHQEFPETAATFVRSPSKDAQDKMSHEQTQKNLR